MLEPYRVLDLTGQEGWFCGKILADLQADVIKIEDPSGDPSRKIGPFYHDIPHPEKSLYWFAYNTNKRSITLNLKTRDGVEIFKRLLPTADFVIESWRPGYLRRLGLGYNTLSKINPRIILISITPFGQTGPYKDYKGSDITAMGLGGVLFLLGDTDRPPVRVSLPQAHLLASAHAAAAATIAHFHRELTGEGQHIDVSTQDAVTRVLSAELVYWEVNRVLCRRLGDKRGRGAMQQRQVWRCADGQLAFAIMGGAYTRGILPLVKWMEEEGMAGVLASVKDWSAVDLNKMNQQEMDAWEEAFSNFFLRHTKAELGEEAVKRQIYLSPAYTFKDICEDEQLRSRHFWVELEHPELDDTITYCGVPFNFSQTPVRIKRRAPLIGEHNEEIYTGELGLSKSELIMLKESNVI